MNEASAQRPSTSQKSSALLGRRDLLKRTALFAGAATFPGVLVGCQDSGDSGGGKDLPKASFGVLRAPTGALAAVTGEKGWFADAGVDVEFKSFAEGGGPKIIQAMAGGTPDIALLNMATAVLALGRGTFDLQIVSVPDDPAPALPLLSVPNITTIPDLKGRRVSTPEDGGQYYTLNSMLAKFDMTLDDVDYKPLPVGDAQAAFLTGKLDAVISSANGTVLIQKNKPETRVLFTSKDFTSGPGPTDPFINTDVIITTRKAAKEKKEAISAFIKGYHEKGIGYLTSQDTKSQAVEEIQDYMKGVGAGIEDVESTTTIVDSIDWYGLDEARDLFTSKTFKNALTRQAKFWQERNVIPKMPDIDAALNTSLIEA